MWKSNFDADTLNEDSDGETLIVMDSERVMKEVHRLYQTKDIGLKEAAKSVSDRNFRVRMPRQKITVLIVGHHNAAKQRFLDLYFSDTRQVAGGGFISKVDYDKLDKIFITQGNQRKVLMGETVLDYCPHLAQLKNVPGLKEHLTTEIATRNTKSLVSFILTPESISVPSRIMPINDTVEFADNNNNVATKKQSFDMGQAIGTLTEAADLIFLFFDPSGLVPPKETLQPFERLWEKHHEKIHLLLAKTEEYEDEATVEGVLEQMVREIWRNPTVRKVGYLPEIYCPDLTSCLRDEERIWNMIQNAADQSVDRALEQLELDATSIKEKLIERKQRNEEAKLYTGDTPVPVWGVGICMVAFGLWRTNFNELICKIREQNCGELVTWNLFLALAGFMILMYCASYKLVDRKPTVLSEVDEILLNRRIHFMNHALIRKEAMEKFYVGMNLN